MNFIYQLMIFTVLVSGIALAEPSSSLAPSAAKVDKSSSVQAIKKTPAYSRNRAVNFPSQQAGLPWQPEASRYRPLVATKWGTIAGVGLPVAALGAYSIGTFISHGWFV